MQANYCFVYNSICVFGNGNAHTINISDSLHVSRANLIIRTIRGEGFKAHPCPNCPDVENSFNSITAKRRKKGNVKTYTKGKNCNTDKYSQ